MKALRIAVLTGLFTATLGIATPAYATDCSDPKKPCGGCHLRLGEMTVEDPRPIECYA